MYQLECLEVPYVLNHYPIRITEYGTKLIQVPVTHATEAVFSDLKKLADSISGPFVYNDGKHRPLLFEYDEDLKRHIVTRHYNCEHFWAEQRKRHAQAKLTRLITQV